MKLTHVAFKEAVWHNGKQTLDAKVDLASFELHPAGVIVWSKTRDRILVPFSNVKWIGLAPADGKP